MGRDRLHSCANLLLILILISERSSLFHRPVRSFRGCLVGHFWNRHCSGRSCHRHTLLDICTHSVRYFHSFCTLCVYTFCTLCVLFRCWPKKNFDLTYSSMCEIASYVESIARSRSSPLSNLWKRTTAQTWRSRPRRRRTSCFVSGASRRSSS